MPNGTATGQQDVRDAYQAAGLSPRQIRRIAEAEAKKHYRIVQPDGERLIDLSLTQEEVAILGASPPRAIERVQAHRADDPHGWLDRRIDECTTTTSSTQPVARLLPRYERALSAESSLEILDDSRITRGFPP